MKTFDETKVGDDLFVYHSKRKLISGRIVDEGYIKTTVSKIEKSLKNDGSFDLYYDISESTSWMSEFRSYVRQDSLNKEACAVHWNCWIKDGREFVKVGMGISTSMEALNEFVEKNNGVEWKR